MIEANCICILVHNISSGLISFILSIISSVSSGKYFANKPCFILFLFFLGGPVDLPPCIRQRPFAIAPFLHGVPALVFAPHNSRPFFARGRFVFLDIYINTTVLICILSMKKAHQWALFNSS